jgi:hypothetical protein
LQDLSIIEEQEDQVAEDPESPENPPGARLMRTKAIGSLALAMARARLMQDDSESDSGSDSGSDIKDLHIMKRKIEFAVAKTNEGTQDEDDESSPRTPPYAAIAARHSPSISPPSAIDITFVRPASRRSGSALRRHSGTESLASLIARAAEFSSSPEASPSPPSVHSSPLASPSPTPSPTFKFNRGPYYDPDFPGHSPCATRNEDSFFGRSAADAVEILLDRFEVIHYTPNTSNYTRNWYDAKYEMGTDMVQGPSRLREVVNAEEVEDAVSTSEEDMMDIANIEEQLRSSPPHADVQEETIIDSNSTFEEDVSGMAIITIEEAPASGFREDDDASSVVTLEFDSPSVRVVSMRPPIAQVALEDEQLSASCVPDDFPSIADLRLQD